MATFGVLYLLSIVFGVILAICWLVLPFALIGTKPLLRELIREMKETNRLLGERLPNLGPPR
jgi:hypothetical protein